MRSATRANYYINHSRLEISRLSLSRSGPVIWNCLPNYVRNESKRKFKQKIHVLLRKILETEDDYVNVITKKIMKMNVSNLTETIYHNIDICRSTLSIQNSIQMIHLATRPD